MSQFWKPGSRKPASGAGNKGQGGGGAATQTQQQQLQQHNPQATLSKSVLGMKFMKRASDPNEDKDTTAIVVERKINISAPPAGGLRAISTGSNSSGISIQKVDTNPYAALPGRRSFGGFNKAVERNYSMIMDEKNFEEERLKAKKDSTMSEEEMLRKYSKLASLPRGPNQGMKPSKNSYNRNSHSGGGSSSSRDERGNDNDNNNDNNDDDDNSNSSANKGHGGDPPRKKSKKVKSNRKRGGDGEDVN